jgi:hypothetical protein
MCAVHHVVLLAEETWIQIAAIITLHARPGDVCPLQYMHENKNFFVHGAATNGPGLRRPNTFLISGEIQRLLNSIQLALSLSVQTFLYGDAQARPARDSCTWEWRCDATLERAHFASRCREMKLCWDLSLLF